MKDTFSVFKTYPTIHQAKEIEALLDKNEIKVLLADNIAPVDLSFSGSTLQNQFEIKIRISDFEKAEKILQEDAEKALYKIDKEYYLFSFTDDELYEILLKSDEWNELDCSLAQKILTERGKPVDADLLKDLKKQRLELLSKPEENQKPWIITGYVFALLGGFLGIIIGYLLWTSKKTLPNGQKVYTYNQNDRKHGKNIFFIGLIIIPFAIALKIVTQI